MNAPTTPPAVNGQAAPARPTLTRRALLVLRAVQVRARFFVVLLVAFAVVGRWDVLRNYWDKLTRGGVRVEGAVSADTEYWCPMCPGVVSDWPGKCPVCNMELVRRPKGEATPLPDGVLARMQLSPYRMQLAGVRTEPVAYRALDREVVAVGFVGVEAGTQVRADVEVFEKDVPFLSPGQAAAVAADAYPGHEAFGAKVRRLLTPADGGGPGFRVALDIDNPRQELRPGMLVTARVHVPVAAVEPFRSLPAGQPPLRPGDPRQVYVCPDHPAELHDHPGRCPHDDNELAARPLAANQRLEWWCPMHPRVTADRPGAECAECGGMKLVPRVVSYRPPGQVLAVPETAVVETGAARLVYVERGPGMFDAVAVALGPRCGGSYPVARGLEAGERVAATGAFLIDAETRLNPNLAASYFGAAGGAGERAPPVPAPPSPSAEEAERAAAIGRLPAADRALAARQKVCPVTGQPLGSMGTPVRVEVQGRAVLLCCDGCRAPVGKNPAKYLAKLHD